jgi:hypothetical protein
MAGGFFVLSSRQLSGLTVQQVYAFVSFPASKRDKKIFFRTQTAFYVI